MSNFPASTIRGRPACFEFGSHSTRRLVLTWQLLLAGLRSVLKNYNYEASYKDT